MVYIKTLKCQGLYSYRDEFEINLSDQTIIVGPNNSGKSTIFKLVRLFVDTFSDRQTLKDYQVADNAQEPFLEIYFELSKTETERIIDFLSFSRHDDNELSSFAIYENREQLTCLLDVMSIRISWKITALHNNRPHIEIDFPKIGLRIYGNLFSLLCASDSSQKDKHTTNHTKLHELLSSFLDLESAKSETIKFFENHDRAIIQSIKVLGTARSDLEHKTRTSLYSYTKVPMDETHEITLRQVLYTILRKGIVYSSDIRGIARSTILDCAAMLYQDLIIQHEDERYRNFLINYNKELERRFCVICVGWPGSPILPVHCRPDEHVLFRPPSSG